MSSFHPQPRRRCVASADCRPCPTLSQPKPSEYQWHHQTSLPLRKGATFHQSKTPSSSPDDPILDIRKLSLRSPTCPDKLEELVAAGESRIASLLDGIDRRFGRGTAGRTSDITAAAVEIQDSLPVPAFLLANVTPAHDPTDIDHDTSKISAHSEKHECTGGQRNHQHLSDSGLGSSISGNSDAVRSSPARLRQGDSPCSLSLPLLLRLANLPGAKAITRDRSVYGGDRHDSISDHASTEKPLDWHEKGLCLTAHAVEKIRKHIIVPLLAQEKLKDYHDLIQDLPSRIGEGDIACLRDLEKTLIFRAPVSTDVSGDTYVLAKCFLDAKSQAKSPASYFRFCQSSIQCIYTAYNHFNEREQRRPGDRPYTPNYFVDLVQQVRRYASIMEQSRRRQAEGKKPLKDDYEPDETLRLQGGLSEDGKPAELVREKDGKIISISTGKVLYKPTEDDTEDEDTERSMARKRKCDIGKEVWRACRECGKSFKRSCDLTKHEKTHSRPWKCPQESCKYHTLGWPTEKECDRHVNDKHSSAPALYKCLWEDCTYTSKRESNCKQHMEKTHGYEYIRSKSKKAARLVPTAQTPSSHPSPASALPSLSTTTSPFEASSNDFTAPPSARTAGSDFDMSATGSESLFGSNSPFDFGSGNDHDFIFNAFNGELQRAQPGLSTGSDTGRGSLDSSVMDFSSHSELQSLPYGGELDSPFDFGPQNCNNPWPAPEDFFTAYNAPAQQPTPAMSDFTFEKDATAGASADANMQDFMGAGSANPFQIAQQGMNPYSPPADVFPQHTSPGMAAGLKGEDFELFGENGESSQMAQMFPALGSVGEQFPPGTMSDSFNSGAGPLGDFSFD